MDTTRLGTTGLEISRIALGMMSYGDPSWRPWVLPEAEAEPFVVRALELGINLFDTADMYSLGVSEEITGRLLGRHARREEVVIATKVFFRWGDAPNLGGLSRKHIFDSVEASLRRLGTDYIDLYQIHRWDPNTPIEETVEALHDVVKAGYVRYLGASSMFAWQFAKALGTADLRGQARFVSMQNHYNLLYREEEREMLPLCRDRGIGVLPWSPLARGWLTRRPDAWRSTARGDSETIADRLYGSEADVAIANAVCDVADERGVPPAQVALAWLLSRPAIDAPIVGATKLGHLEDAAAAAELELGDDEIARLEAPYRPRAVAGHA